MRLQNGTSPYFGAVIGRVANRIADAEFDLNGKLYYTSANEGNNTLHGGIQAWNVKNWTFNSVTPNSLVATLYSPDEDMVSPPTTHTFICSGLTLRLCQRLPKNTIRA